MTKEAINYKEKNKNLNFHKMSLDELNQLPKHLGIVEFKTTKTSFKMLNILNDDSTATEYFWKGISDDSPSLNLWFNICKEEGIYLDVAVRGLGWLSGVAPALFAGSSGSGSFRVDAGRSSQKEFFEF